MTAHRSQSTPTPADAAIRQWSGTASEWDAERDLRADRLALAGYHIAHESRIKTATATMPPRPVEPPYTCEQCGVTDGDVYRFLGNYGHLTAESCREALKRELRALRDGPAPRYVEDGWRVRYATGAHYNVFPDKDVATAIAAGIGGTAHAIYRRVEGDK